MPPAPAATKWRRHCRVAAAAVLAAAAAAILVAVAASTAPRRAFLVKSLLPINPRDEHLATASPSGAKVPPLDLQVNLSSGAGNLGDLGVKVPPFELEANLSSPSGAGDLIDSSAKVLPFDPQVNLSSPSEAGNLFDTGVKVSPFDLEVNASSPSKSGNPFDTSTKMPPFDLKANLSSEAASPPPPSPSGAASVVNLGVMELPFDLKANLSVVTMLPPSTSPAPSPVENFDDFVEESAHPDLKMPHFDLKVNSSTGSVHLLQESISSAMPIRNSDGRTVLPPPHYEAPLWLTPADQELIYAKKEIKNAPVVSDDTDLYAPLFRNVSVFRRSYELMESFLKVYIYHDGAKPIFHSPELKGIYSSEGWFMRLMESNQNFIVKDPNKAHLFYLPYSSHQLERVLYEPGSHTIEPLSVFVKNYIDMISAKFPFWNRTKGADHFFVACHDWGPYTTKLHDELRKNTIKALCNADLSEGVFIRGRDVSLPETYIRSPKRPLRDIGGKPVSERSILAFFAGQMHGRVRPILLQYWGGKDKDMRIYNRLPRRLARGMSYVQHMKSSKYCICPMGYEVNSPRIVEAIYYECVPVIIADNFVLPFDDVLNWSAFSVVVAEKDIPKLKEILLGILPSEYTTMQMNVKRLQKHFLWHAKPIKYDIFHMILHSVWFSRVNQFQIQ